MNKKRAVFVIAENVFRDEEYFTPKQILTEEGIEVITASTITTEATGKLGAKVKPDLLVTEINIESYNALVFIGGGGAAQYFDDKFVHSLAEQVVSQGKVLAAICIAPVILGRAGLLKGKRATVYIDGADELRNNGAQYTGNSVEIDGKIITANGPEAAEDFGRQLSKMILEINF